MGTRGPYCAGFKALMLWRALESAGEGYTSSGPTLSALTTLPAQ